MTNNDYTKAEFISWLGINGLDTKFELSIADAIETQIKTLDPYAFWAWGAKNLTTIIDNNGIENGLSFTTSGLVKNKGYITITLNPKDYYDVTFGKIRKSKWEELNRQEDVFFGDLIDIIDSMVGSNTSSSTRIKSEQDLEDASVYFGFSNHK
tara:strand:+ start:154 stop:612 length:459 start_codon:yes stop_codon:yes gene_type:complete